MMALDQITKLIPRVTQPGIILELSGTAAPVTLVVDVRFKAEELWYFQGKTAPGRIC